MKAGDPVAIEMTDDDNNSILAAFCRKW